MPVDPALRRRACELHEQLRAFLIRTMSREHPLAIAGALTYELVSIIACAAETKADARDAFDDALRVAREQLDAFGVGHPHP